LTNANTQITLGIAAILLTAGTLALALPTMSGYDAVVYPKQQGKGMGYHHYGEMALKPGYYAAGSIASLQNDESGNPTWIVSGYWKGSLTNVTKAGSYSGGNQTQTSTSNSTSAVTNSTVSDGESQLPTARFKAIFDMVRTNGSAMHQHQIYNFTLTGLSMPNNATIVYNGTTTITMKDGPVQNVPISVTAMDGNVIAIWIDPSRVDNHFGNTPIYGTIVKAFEVKK
jgi:hypothetical protein